jgi:uncharacterized SAM-binding protein YcdF (DUF218 family)
MHFFVFKALLRTVLLPPVGLVLLAVLGAILLGLRQRRSGWACLITGLSLLWLLSMPPVAQGLTSLTQHYPAFNPAAATDAQAIVILGGPDSRNDAPEYGDQPAASLELLERLNYGAWLSRQTHLPILVSSDPANVYAMATSLTRDFQVVPHWVDWRSRDTFDNARNSAALLRASHVTSILLVTSTTHMLRAVREFAATGLAVTAAPVHVLVLRDAGLRWYLPGPEAMLLSNRAVYELIGERVRELLVVLHLRRQQPG